MPDPVADRLKEMEMKIEQLKAEIEELKERSDHHHDNSNL